MNTTVFTKDGQEESYSSLSETSAKLEIYDSISRKYSNENIDRIQVEYDYIEVETLGGTKVEPGATAVVHTLEELKAELGKYGG